MSYRPTQAQKTTRLLQQSASLQRLVARAQSVERLQELLNQYLQPAARKHCHVATVQDATLTLIVTDGLWATRLRYQQKRLLEQLQQTPEFNQVLRIQFKVRPPMQPEKAATRNIDFSEHTGHVIHASAQAISDPVLRKALERLALHTKKS
ncbi:MAG: DUF721 domain-containing protein [Pseudomonas sp.]|jgi:hypothetical protein|nr:DUF721 domain-containing protein [Pseudomonas sp.]